MSLILSQVSYLKIFTFDGFIRICFEVGPKVIVRTEEVLIVMAVLVLWVGAIALFFNRWGKIRMLEPYQPKFQQQHRSSCPLVEIDPIPIHKHPSFSRISMGTSLPLQQRMGSISGSSGYNIYAYRGNSFSYSSYSIFQEK